MWIIIAVLGLLAIGAGVFSFMKRKDGSRHEPDYRTFFAIGVVWIIFGFIPGNWMFLVLGFAFAAIGLANKKKWKKQAELTSEKKKLVKIMLVIGLLGFVVLTGAYVYVKKSNNLTTRGITNFRECVEAGNPIMESYPQRCSAGKKTFVEYIGNELEKAGLIRIDGPRPNQSISSPLTISGEAIGLWFFEGDFPVALTDENGEVIAESFVTAEGNWMTEDFVKFHGVLEFDSPEDGTYGLLILRKDNPSDLLEFDDALELPVVFGE